MCMLAYFERCRGVRGGVMIRGFWSNVPTHKVIAVSAIPLPSIVQLYPVKYFLWVVVDSHYNIGQHRHSLFSSQFVISLEFLL